MIQIAVCDDNQRFAVQVETEILSQRELGIDCEVFSSGDQLMKSMELGNHYQIYFLDIEMEGHNGIETAAYIRETDQNALIIYMTEHQEYVYQVFATLPFRFLVKPFSKEEITKTLKECLENLTAVKRYFFFKIERQQYQIPYEEIHYFEGRGRKVCLYAGNMQYEFYGKIADVMDELDSKLFCRIHTSYLVKMDDIRSIDEKWVRLADGNLLPISKSYRQQVKEQHLRYMIWKSGVKR